VDRRTVKECGRVGWYRCIVDVVVVVWYSVVRNVKLEALDGQLQLMRAGAFM